MRHLCKCVSFLVSMIILDGCDEGLDIQDESSQMVVEGWIEDGGFPVVMLTRSLPVSTEYQSIDDMGDYLLRWAKVTIDDGTDSVVLTGKYDDGYYPPFVYTTSRMKGEAGRHYSLKVEYRDYYATATTTIPLSLPSRCAFRVERCNDADTLFQIKAFFKDNPTEKNFYQFFIREGTATKQYQASYLGTFDDAVLDTVVDVPVYRGQQLGRKKYTPYFKNTDTVSVKLANIDEVSFRFWNSYTKTLSLSNNMFLSTSSDIETNIFGGRGYWCGYSTVVDYIVIRDSID